MTNGRGKSDSPVGPAKSPNKAEGPAAEVTEGRGLAKGNSPERNALRTQGRGSAPSALERVRQAARKDRKLFVRFADDFVAGFQHRDEAERFLAELRERFARFGLQLHADKTRIVEFGRFAEQNRRRRGASTPETFNFLGFTHSCGKTRKGRFMVLRQTMRPRWQAKLRAVKEELRRRMHTPIREQGAYCVRSCRVTSVITGCPGTDRPCAPFARQWGICGGRCCAVAARVTTCRGTVCAALLRDGFQRPTFVILIRSSVSASSPEVGAACSNSARPDLRRGS